MRYAFVGLGHRVQLYIDALLGEWSDTGEIVALCDVNRTRIGYYLDRIGHEVPCFAPEEFGEMLRLADAVVVATVDATHARYVVAALEAGKDVIVEKPLCTTAEDCAAIVEAAERSTGRLVVTFNYRYSPRNSAVRRLVADGAIGDVTSVHFEWVLDTIHGADYFRRWHRDKANSGGLLVHKSTHHFDLVNWWLADTARSVYARSALRFYGAGNARARGLRDRPGRAHGAPGLGTDPYLLDISADPRLKRLYLDAEHEDGYLRDQDVFDEGVTIEDNMAVLAGYSRGATLTYSLNAHGPFEGYRVAMNGTEGRLELEVVERAWTPPRAAIDPTASDKAHATGAFERLVLQRHWHEAEEVAIPSGTGGHGGGDALMLDDVFRGAGDDPLGRQAGYRAGVAGVMVGVAANRSAATGAAVLLEDGGTRYAD
ncbi:Gfo/Idh/MocA family oxidoreductase [Streptosporangium sp. NPDC002721]|uniref:Gfo/Idh/MocA family oxidoreductase n=1 Tax=Streptosporangium sp. NPDC002721 TaxID=3366188 RepID=UPI0036B30722